MKQTRTITHADHTDTETLIAGVWAVTQCDVILQTKETTMYNGYTEPKSQTDARGFKIAMEFVGYSKAHNTEAEVDRVRDLIDCAELNDKPYAVKVSAAIETLKSLMSTDDFAQWNNQRINEIERHLIDGTPYTSTFDAAIAMISNYIHPVDATLHAEDLGTRNIISGGEVLELGTTSGHNEDIF